MNADEAQKLSDDLWGACDEIVAVERALVLAFESGKAAAVARILSQRHEYDWEMTCQWLLEECESMREEN
jgi:hypothetical protein